MSAGTHWRRRMRVPFRVIRQRPRLFVSALIGAATIFFMPGEWRLSSRMLIGWDIGVALYLILAFHLMASETVAQIRRRACEEDEGRLSMLFLTSAAALASVAAIVIELQSVPGHGTSHQPFDLGLATVTIFLSWLFTHTMFGLHYAHEYYDQNGGKGGGLEFPGNEDPDYWDFAYFSFVIGMTCQVSDVGVSCRPIRRTAAAHGIVSFLFNTALLALTVNITASAI
jgi:uncharacterized membrane protein